LAWIPEAKESVEVALALYKKYWEANRKEMEAFARFDTLYLGTVLPDGTHELYDGKLRWVDAVGNIVADQVDPGPLRGVYRGTAVGVFLFESALL
jgi:NAD-reducing hydrogenase large subunit